MIFVDHLNRLIEMVVQKRQICSLRVGADPVHNSVLVKVMLVPEGETLALSELSNKDE